jgi:drug/metabolite transporter (DMT)-like permease
MIRFKLILTAIFWGGTFIAGRVVAREMEPFTAAFLRFATASVFLLIITWKIEGNFPRINFHSFILLTLLGLSGIAAYNFFFFSGLKTIPAGRAAVIIANNPILISILSVIFFKEKISITRAAGILCSVSGAVLAISRGNLQDLSGQLGSGEFYIFMCVLSWVSYSLLGKTVMMKFSPLVSVTYSCLIGTILLLLPSCGEGLTDRIFQFSLESWLGIVYLGFFGTVLGFLWYYQGIKSIGPMKASIFINFVPISALFLSYLILQESLNFTLFFGTIMVVGGVYLTNKSQLVRK